jgi:hypothetical protein
MARLPIFRPYAVLSKVFKGVDPMLEGYSKLIAIDAEAQHQIVHRRRFGKAHDAPYEPLDPGPPVEVFALEWRRVLHAQIVDVIETLDAERLGEQVERLASHALRGEVWDKAVTYCQQADVRASDRAAFREAAIYFEQAFQVLVHLLESGDTRRLTIELRLALGVQLSVLGEHGRCLALLSEVCRLAGRGEEAW